MLTRTLAKCTRELEPRESDSRHLPHDCVWEFDALRSKIYIRIYCICRYIYIYIYIYIYPYAHSVFISTRYIHGRASLPRLFSKTPPSLTKLISFADRKFDGVSGRHCSRSCVLHGGCVWHGVVFVKVCGDTCRQVLRRTLRSMH